jgi:hypothetical protein
MYDTSGVERTSGRDATVRATAYGATTVRTTRSTPPARTHRRDHPGARYTSVRTTAEAYTERVQGGVNIADEPTRNESDIIGDSVWREIARQGVQELRAVQNWLRLFYNQHRIRTRTSLALTYVEYQNEECGNLRWGPGSTWITSGKRLFRLLWCAVRRPYKTYEIVAGVSGFLEAIWILLNFLWDYKCYFFTTFVGAAAQKYCTGYGVEENIYDRVEHNVENVEAPSEAPLTNLLQ